MHILFIIIFLLTFNSAPYFIINAADVNSLNLNNFKQKIISSTSYLKSSNNSTTKCVIKNDKMHRIMELICEVCHNMFSHQNPNIRANCR